MSLACRIIGGQVQAPNGKQSKLFQSLELRFGRDSAMDLYALTETMDYRDSLYRRDSNGEMVERDFLKFALKDEAPMELSKERVDFAQRFGYEEISQLDKLYEGGVFQPTFENLSETGLFLEDEVYNILYSKETQKSLKNFIEQGVEVEVGRVEGLRVEGDSYNSIGIRPLMDPVEVEKEVLENLVGLQTNEEIDATVQTLNYPGVIERYNSDTQYREEIRERVKSSAEIRTEIDTDGTVELLLNTVDVSKIDDLADTAYRIEQLTDKDMIVEEYEVVVDTLVDMGVEIEFDEFSLYNKSVEELKDFSKALNDFVEKPTMETTRFFAEQIDLFRNRPETQVAPYNNNGRVNPNNLRVLETSKSEVQVFEEMSMVKHKGDTYLKIQDKYSTEQLYDILYDAVVRTPSIIGIENLPSVENNTEILEAPINKEEVIQDIKDFILDRTKNLEFSDTDTQQKIEIYKTYYGSDIVRTEQKNVVAPQEIDNYIMEEFVGDFNAERLRSKQEGSLEYDNFYKHFKVDHNGIGLVNDSQFTRDIVNNTMPEGIAENLYRYSELSNSLDLGMRAVEVDPVVKDRLEAQQNPQTVKEMEGDYSIVGEGEIVSRDVGEFTKIRGEVYEKALEYQDRVLYKKLPTTPSNFKNTNIDRPVSDKTEQFLRDFVPTNNNTVNYKKHLSKRELADINEKHFICS